MKIYILIAFVLWLRSKLNGMCFIVCLIFIFSFLLMNFVFDMYIMHHNYFLPYTLLYPSHAYQHHITPNNPFSRIMSLVWFCDPFSLSRINCLTIVLKISNVLKIMTHECLSLNRTFVPILLSVGGNYGVRD